MAVFFQTATKVGGSLFSHSSIITQLTCLAGDYTHIHTHRMSCKTKYKNSAKNLTEVKNEHIYTKPSSHTTHYASSVMSKEMNAHNTGYIVLCGKEGEAPFHTAKANCLKSVLITSALREISLNNCVIQISAQINNSET